MRRVPFFLLFLCLLGTGCVSVETNIPWNKTHVTIVNGTQFELELLVDGFSKGVIPPGEYARVGFHNWSGDYAETAITVLARNPQSQGSFGSAARRFYVSGYDRRSEVWQVGPENLR